MLIQPALFSVETGAQRVQSDKLFFDVTLIVPVTLLKPPDTYPVVVKDKLTQTVLIYFVSVKLGPLQDQIELGGQIQID